MSPYDLLERLASPSVADRVASGDLPTLKAVYVALGTDPPTPEEAMAVLLLLTTAARGPALPKVRKHLETYASADLRRVTAAFGELTSMGDAERRALWNMAGAVKGWFTRRRDTISVPYSSVWAELSG